MPTPQRMKYFQPASRLAGVRYSVTSNTVDRVAASIATHMSPMIVGREGNQHRRHEQLVHAVIQAQLRRRDTRPCSASMRM